MRYAVVTGVAILWGGFCLADGGVDGKVAKARETAAVAAAAAERLSVMREMAFNAVDNAVASERQVEDQLICAIKSNQVARVRSLKRELHSVRDETEEARDLAEQIVQLSVTASAAVSQARDRADAVAVAKTEREANGILRSVNQQVAVATDAAADAESLAEKLKRRWLVPVTAATNTVTSSKN